MADELFGQFDMMELELEDRRLRREGACPVERMEEFDAATLWQSVNTEVLLIAPEYPSGGAEVRQFECEVWIGRSGEEYWFFDVEDTGSVSLVHKGFSDANKAIWQSLNSEVFAVVRDIERWREGPEPELVRHCWADEWLSLWHGVCEPLASTLIEDLEFVPAAEWEEQRPGIRHTQVQERIAAKLRERGLEPVVVESIQNHTENESILPATWDSARSQVFIWVRSCQIYQEARPVRYWQGDQWMVQESYYHWTVATSKLRDWGCLVPMQAWERLQRARRAEKKEKVDWRKFGF